MLTDLYQVKPITEALLDRQTAESLRNGNDVFLGYINIPVKVYKGFSGRDIHEQGLDCTRDGE